MKPPQRIDPLIRRLSSESDHEIVSCVRMIGKALNSSGFDFNDLADHIFMEIESQKDEINPQYDVDWRASAYYCVCRADELKPREYDFINDMYKLSMRGRYRPTEKQLKWIYRIEEKLKAGE